MKSLRSVLLLLCCTTFAFGRDRDFRGVVNAIEQTYGVRHLRIPLLGLATFFARPEGVSDLHLAVFEGFDAPPHTDEVRRVVEDSLGEGWYSFVGVHSRDDDETTLIYTSPSGGKMRMMIVNLEPSEATVVELNLSERAFRTWLSEPGENAGDEASHHHHFD